MNDYLKAAMLRKEDDVVPPQFQAEVAQARYDQLSAADKLITSASTWAPRASDYAMFDMPEQVGRGATKLQEGAINLFGEIEKWVGSQIGQDARNVRRLAENVGTPALDEAQKRAITGKPDQYNAYLLTEFLRNHGAEKAAEFSGNKNENWNRHTSDFLNWLAEGVEDQGKLITKVGEAHAPAGYREGAYYGATPEGEPTQDRPVPTNPFTGEAVLQGQYDQLHGGKAPQGKVKGLIETAMAIAPDTLYSLGEYYAANVATKPVKIANAVHMGIVDAIHAYQNNTDPWKAFAHGVFLQQVVFRGVGQMTRVPRALATAAYFGGKEAVEAGLNAPDGQFMTVASDTFLDPVNLTNTLTMVALGQTHGGGKPLPELGRELQYWVSNLPKEARVHVDTAALAFKTLTLKKVETYFDELFVEARRRFPTSTTRYYRAVTEPAKADAEGNIIEPEKVLSPAFLEILFPNNHVLRAALAVGPDGNPTLGIPDYLYWRNGRALAMSINSDGSGNLSAVTGETREIGPLTTIAMFSKPVGDRIPAGVYGVAEDISWNSRANDDVFGHEVVGKWSHLAIGIGKTNSQRADMIIEMGRNMPEEYATQDEIRAVAEKVRNLPPDPNARTPLTKKEVEIYQNAEEMFVSQMDSARRAIGEGRNQGPSSVRQSLDFLTNLAHTIFRPEHNEAIWQIYSRVSSAARSIQETYGKGQSGYQYLPEVYREGREAARSQFIDSSGVQREGTLEIRDPYDRSVKGRVGYDYKEYVSDGTIELRPESSNLLDRAYQNIPQEDFEPTQEGRVGAGLLAVPRVGAAGRGRNQAEADREIREAVRGRIGMGEWSPELAGHTLYLLPDGTAVFGNGITHGMTAKYLGYANEMEMLEAGAIRFGGSNYGIENNRINVNLYHRPTPKMVETLNRISEWLAPMSNVTLEGRPLRRTGDIEFGHAGFRWDGNRLGEYVYNYGVGSWPEVYPSAYTSGTANRMALRTVTPSMFTKTEKAFMDSKTIPDSGVEPDRLLNVLSNKFQVGKEEVKRLRLDDMVRVYRSQGKKITRDNLKEWVMNYGIRLNFNREGGKQPYTEINRRMEDAGVRAKAALQANGIDSAKAQLVVTALMGGHKTREEAANWKPPVEDAELTGGGGGYARNDFSLLKGAAAGQDKAMEILGINDINQLKDVIGEQQYAAVEPILQELVTEAGTRNSFMQRFRSTDGDVSHSQYTSLTAGIRSPAPKTSELVQCIATYDLANKYSRDFFTPEDAKAFFQDWYQQEFEWNNEANGVIEAKQAINPESAYPERGNTPLIRKTAKGTWEIPYETFSSTSLATDSHSFNKAWRGTGVVGWFRGGFIPLPNGKRAFLNAEVQGDAVQNIEDQGVRELPIPKATIDMVRKEYAESIGEGEVESFGVDKDAFKVTSDLFWKKKFSLTMPNDYVEGTGGYAPRPEVKEERKNRSIKGGTLQSVVKRLRIALDDSVVNHGGTFMGLTRSQQRTAENFLTYIGSGMNTLGAIRTMTEAQLEARHPHRASVPLGGEDWYDVGIMMAALKEPIIQELLSKTTDFKPEMLPAFIDAPANAMTSMSSGEYRILGATAFTKMAGLSYYIGIAPAGVDKATLDPRDPEAWGEKIVYAPDKESAEKLVTQDYQNKMLKEWLEGAPDAPWAEAWREQLVLESLRYAAEAGYDYYTQRTAYHTYLEWGSSGFFWTPSRAVMQEIYGLKVDNAGGVVTGSDRELQVPTSGRKLDTRWDEMIATVGRQEAANRLLALAPMFEKFQRHIQNPTAYPLTPEESAELERVRTNSRNVGNAPDESISHYPRRIRQIAERLANTAMNLEQAVQENLGSDAVKTFFFNAAPTKYSVYRGNQMGQYDHTFKAPEFDTEQEAKAWADQWMAEHGESTKHNLRHNEPWTDTSAELYYAVVKNGERWQINKHKSGYSDFEVVGDYATKEEAEAAKNEMPRSGPITQWKLHQRSFRGGGRENDPEVYINRTPEENAAEADQRGGNLITSFADLMGNTGKERWAHGLWKRMQKSPTGGAFFPRYEGQKYNYETVLPNILKKRIKKFGIEPVLMNTVDMAGSDKPLEAQVNKVTQEVTRAAQAFSEDAYGQELQRIHRAIVPAVQALSEEGIAELTRMENNFRAGNRAELINWVREAQRRAGSPPDAFTNWDTDVTTTQEVYYVKLREQGSNDWVTVRLDGVTDQNTAEAIASMFLGYGKKSYTNPTSDLKYYRAEPNSRGEFIVKYYYLERSPTSVGGLRVHGAAHSAHNSMANAVAKAGELNQQVLDSMTGYRETMVIGFPITPELRSDLLFTSRSRYKMREVPAVTLQPATEAELEQFKDLFDPDATPELITKGKILGINLDKVRTVEDVKRAISATEAIYSHYIDKERRGERSHATTVAAAKALGMTVDELLARPEGQAYNAEQMHSAFNLAVASGRVLKEMAGYLAESPSEENNARFAQALGLHKQIQAKFAGARAEAGRSVEILKVGASGEGQYLSSIGEALMRIPGATPQQVAEMVSKLPTLEQTSRFVKQMERATTKDVLIEIWINGLLSGLKSHSANIIGNLTTTFLGPVERLGAGLTSEGGGVYPTESLAMGVGFVTGLYDAMRIATHNAPWNWADKMAETRGMTEDTSKLDYRRGAISSKQLGLTGPIGFFVDGIGRVIRTPGGALDTMDQIFKLVNYRMELNAQALRTALNEGAHGKDIIPRVKEILEGRDTEVLDLIQARSNEWADYQTFTKELGAPGKALMQFSNSKWWAKMIMPFIRTPANIFKYGMERMPFLNLALQSTRADLEAGGVRRDMAMGRISTSALVLGVAYALAKAGAISGYGPQDKNLRKEKEATGWLPYAIKVGDTWYSYNRVEPIGALLGVTASMNEMWDDLPPGEAEAVLLAATLSFSQAMVSKTYMKGVSDVLTAVADPGANTEKVLRSYLGSAIPTVLNQADSAIFDRQIREVWTRMDALKDRVPGLSATLPPKRDAFGHPIFYPDAYGPDFVSPIATRTKKNYPAMEELVKQGVPVGPPPRWVFGDRPSGLYTSALKAEDLRDGVELNHQQYDRLAVLRGQMAEEALLNLMSNPQYRNLSDGPDGGKAKIIKDIFYKSTQAARAKLLSEDKELEGKVTGKMMRRAQGMQAQPGNLGMSP